MCTKLTIVCRLCSHYSLNDIIHYGCNGRLIRPEQSRYRRGGSVHALDCVKIKNRIAEPQGNLLTINR